MFQPARLPFLKSCILSEPRSSNQVPVPSKGGVPLHCGCHAMLLHLAMTSCGRGQGEMVMEGVYSNNLITCKCHRCIRKLIKHWCLKRRAPMKKGIFASRTTSSVIPFVIFPKICTPNLQPKSAQCSAYLRVHEW